MDNKETIKIALTDDHPLTRKGIRDLIESFGSFRVILETADGKELVETLKNKPDLVPHVCVFDVNNRGIEAYNPIRDLKRRWPMIKVLVFSQQNDDYVILHLLRYGVNGIVRKDCSTREFVKALNSLYFTDNYFADCVARRLFEMQRSNNPMLPMITDREMEFLEYCCTELNYKGIADLMGISVRTIETFRDSLFSKFNLRSRTGLAMFAIQNRIVSLSGLQLLENAPYMQTK